MRANRRRRHRAPPNAARTVRDRDLAGERRVRQPDILHHRRHRRRASGDSALRRRLRPDRVLGRLAEPGPGTGDPQRRRSVLRTARQYRAQQRAQRERIPQRSDRLPKFRGDQPAHGRRQIIDHRLPDGRNMKFRDSTGATLTIARKLGEGGEGVVFTTNEKLDVVAKIYNHPLTSIQIAKLEEMVHAADDTLESVSAWPTAMLYKDARAVGFTMPMLTSQHPLHDLFGPKRRQALFPNAHWSFLVHTGINLARAFEVLHGRNIVCLLYTSPSPRDG